MIGADLIGRGIDPDTISLRMVSAYLNNYDVVQRGDIADALGGQYGN